jgi:serine protease DegQ
VTSNGRRLLGARLALAAVVIVGLPACKSGEPAQVTRPPAADAAPPTHSAGVFGAIPEIVRRVEPSVVAVLTDAGEGSGVVWDTAGKVVTNRHVVAGATRIELAFADGKRSGARVLATDAVTDLAVLDADRKSLPVVPFADTLPVVGELAVAIGNPLGFENTVTAGIVSGLQRSIPGSATRSQALVDLIQTDAAISPGNSGGALVSAGGEVIGINVAYIPPQAQAVSIGFAIPAPTVREVVTELLSDGEATHPFFGVRPAPLTPEIRRQLDVEPVAGVVVLEVVAGGPAERAGIVPGDVIVAVGGTPVDGVEAFLGVLRRGEPGQELEAKVVRGDEERTIRVRLGERRG